MYDDTIRTIVDEQMQYDLIGWCETTRERLFHFLKPPEGIYPIEFDNIISLLVYFKYVDILNEFDSYSGIDILYDDILGKILDVWYEYHSADYDFYEYFWQDLTEDPTLVTFLEHLIDTDILPDASNLGDDVPYVTFDFGQLPFVILSLNWSIP